MSAGSWSSRMKLPPFKIFLPSAMLVITVSLFDLDRPLGPCHAEPFMSRFVKPFQNIKSLFPQPRILRAATAARRLLHSSSGSAARASGLQQFEDPGRAHTSADAHRH